MTIPKKKWKELVLQMLCSLDCTGSLDINASAEFMRKLKITKKQFFVARDFVLSLFEKKDVLDRKIKSYTGLSNIGMIEKNILRIAFFTIGQEGDDIALAVSESLRLVKKFADPERAVLIQAVINKEFQNQIDKK